MVHIFLYLTAILVLTAGAETEVGGILTRNTRWNADEGPYRLTGDLLVSRNVRLTIAPGCRIICSGNPPADTAIPQYDELDIKYVSIKVYGTLICSGNSEKRIVFTPDTQSTTLPAWYGILLDGSDDQFTEIAHTDLTGACNGITVRKCAPLIHHVVLEYNHTGIICIDNGSARIYNSLIGFNTSAGIHIDRSNPAIHNSIIVFNRNNGIWCDGISRISFTYNCIFGNYDGDMLDCDPEIGLPVKKNKNGDSIDIFNNIRRNPVFCGSAADSASRQKDLTLPTGSEFIRDSAIAAIIHQGVPDSSPADPPRVPVKRYQLSEYSPCRNAGDPSSAFKDRDGSRNDMGIYGGPTMIGRK